MTFLPIVARELRVAARRRGTYRVRMSVALIAMVLTGIIFFVNFGAPQNQLGRHLFEGLSVLAIIYCLFSGRISTADCLSEEKREGTLGLLFLTDLKGYDVVLGKLVATSVSAFYGLLAVLPVLALPLLLGGITNTEFWRVALVLVNTFLLSLAIGIFGSALSRDARRAMAANLTWGLLLMAVLPASMAAVIYFAGLPVRPEAFMVCPIYSFYLCDDVRYKAEPHYFWWSVAVVHLLTWLLLALTGWIVPRTWQDKPTVRTAKAGLRDLWKAWNYGRAGQRSAFRKQLLDVNAYYWLAGRARLKPVHVWTFLGLMSGWWIWSWSASGTVWFDPLTATVTALILNSTLKLWIGLEAGQQLAEDQKAGALELLLSTPLTVRDILRGQLLALRRQFLGPLLLVVAIELIFMIGQMSGLPGDSRNVATLMAGVLMLVSDALALSIVGIRVALTARSTHRAVLTTISRILVLPWVVFGLGAGMAAVWAELFSTTGWSPDWRTYLGLWFSLGIFTDLIFGLLAVRQLLNNFRQLATQRFAQTPARFARSLNPRTSTTPESAVDRATVHHQPADHTAPPISTRKRTLLIGTALGVVVAGMLIYFKGSRPNFPPAVVVSMTRSNAPLRVLPGMAVFMILPDGSLWRWGGSGRPEFPRAVVPEQIGTNCDWTRAAAMGNRIVGVHGDGTLWEWGWGARGIGRFTKDPEQIDAGHDWISASAGGVHSVALKRDGTLWAWGDNSAGQVGNGPGPYTPHPVQVGTNQDWAAATCQGSYTLGLRTNGTLWVWGRIYSFRNRLPAAINFPTPTQVCRETNWAGLSTDSGWAWTRSGEVWAPMVPTGASPDPEATVAVTGQFIATNFIPGHLIGAMCDTAKLYQVRADGTLWEKSYSFGPWAAPPADKWRQVGKRSDWVALWSVWGTAIGLTADGTIWTWGIDQSRDPTHDFPAKLKLLQMRIQGLLGGSPGRGAGVSASQPYQKEPRPLMRLKTE
jgi:hypothetical protein